MPLKRDEALLPKDGYLDVINSLQDDKNDDIADDLRDRKDKCTIYRIAS